MKKFLIELKRNMKNKDKKYCYNNRKSIMVSLDDSIYHKLSDFIEVTEWANGEGWDIILSNNKDQTFSLHETEFDEIKKMIKQLNKNG